MDNEFLSVRDVAKKLGIRPVTVYKYIREGRLKGSYFKIGGIYKFGVELLDKLLEDMIERRKNE